MNREARLAFSAVVGQDDAKLALLLAAVDPNIGGVLLRGQKGSAKTTLARGLAALLADDSPFVELPLGATEDRVIGSLDVATALTRGELRFHPGLLAAAHGGVLYVDEVNLLADHLVDTLLDVSVSGVNLVEREGVSHRHPARFVLVGSMNPEEGELRPQLLDRFGLCVSVAAPNDVPARTEAVRRRLALDELGADASFATEDAVLARTLAGARPAAVPDTVLELASQLALAAGAEGLRADLTICRAAAAHAGLAGRSAATAVDVRRVAPLVLAHRSRRAPFDPPTLSPEEVARTVDEVLGDPPDAPGEGIAPERPLAVGRERRSPPTDHPTAPSARGRLVRDVPSTAAPAAPVAVLATARELGRRRALDPESEATVTDLRAAVRTARAGRLVVLTVDLSGSMGARARAEAATGTVLGLLTQAYERRDQVALVGFRGSGAEVLLAPTASVEVARNRLGTLATGGETPLADGIRAALALATRDPNQVRQPLVVLLTDGRATGRPDALDDALRAAAAVRAAGVAAVVVDCETGPTRLGLAAALADAMGARCVAVDALDPAAVTRVVRDTR